MQTETHYGVLIGLKKGNRPFLATAGKGAPAIFDRKHRALCFRDELGAHPHRVKGKVIRVAVSYEIPE